MSLLGEAEMADFRASIEKRGLRESDFTVQEGGMKRATDGSGGEIGVVTITYERSQKTRQYPVGQGAYWPQMFEIDLEREAFF